MTIALVFTAHWKAWFLLSERILFPFNTGLTRRPFYGHIINFPAALHFC